MGLTLDFCRQLQHDRAKDEHSLIDSSVESITPTNPTKKLKSTVIFLDKLMSVLKDSVGTIEGNVSDQLECSW
ncbi:unnamed protein product [Echinostoma caproni]|uniref:MIP-T3 domain-containing protein n=1 Tax=Echinostoma caproni TaxID=27848 RepID=A0A183B8D2_9TREM|nr:unnamed protein product [Echinostoma caproni]